MKQLGQDKSTELLQQPLDEKSETNGLLNKLAEDVVNPEPPMGLQFASISLDPKGNIITWKTGILDPGDVRDPGLLKLRRRKVGGYGEYLSIENQQYAANPLADLDPQFGYSF
jgi:hypothetical protein